MLVLPGVAFLCCAFHWLIMYPHGGLVLRCACLLLAVIFESASCYCCSVYIISRRSQSDGRSGKPTKGTPANTAKDLRAQGMRSCAEIIWLKTRLWYNMFIQSKFLRAL